MRSTKEAEVKRNIFVVIWFNDKTSVEFANVDDIEVEDGFLTLLMGYEVGTNEEGKKYKNSQTRSYNVNDIARYHTKIEVVEA